MKNALSTDPALTAGHSPSPDFTQGLVGWTLIPEKGHAAIALKDIAAGTLLENAPVIVMDSHHLTGADGKPTPLMDYAFWWGEITDAEMGEQCAIVKGGYLALANHDPAGNSAVEQDRPRMMMVWRALKDIRAGEEITFDYDCDLWFDAHA